MKKFLLFIVVVILLSGFRGAITADQEEAGNVKIRITSGQTVILGVLDDTAPARDLAARLPLTLHMNAHQNREYYADIRLAKSGPTSDGYRVGDIAYWTPGNSLVFFHGRGYTGSLIIMGHITDGLDKLPTMGDHFTARIEKVGSGERE